MNNYPILSVYALASKAQTNKELLIMAGLGLLIAGGVCYYYYKQNQDLKLSIQKYKRGNSYMENEISSMSERIISLQDTLNQINKDKADLIAQIAKFRIQSPQNDV